MAAAGRFMLLEPLLGTIVLGAGAIEHAGTAKQQELLGSIATGDMILAFCHTEPGAGYDRDLAFERTHGIPSFVGRALARRCVFAAATVFWAWLAQHGDKAMAG